MRRRDDNDGAAGGRMLADFAESVGTFATRSASLLLERL